jgi:hypothetical protein
MACGARSVLPAWHVVARRVLQPHWQVIGQQVPVTYEHDFRCLDWCVIAVNRPAMAGSTVD